MRGIVDRPDRRGAEEIRPGADVLEAFLEIRGGFLWHEGLHDDGRRDGIGEGLEDAEPKALKELLLAAQEDAHAGLRVVLEVQKLPELDEDVVGQALGFVDDEDGINLFERWSWRT